MSALTRLACLLLPILLLVACATPDPVPDFRYYRLGPAAAPDALAQPLLDRPLVVESFRADGVHGERPILYSADADSLRVIQYHYQLWNDPPPLMVQRRMQQWLAAAGVSTLVTERIGPRVPAYRLRGTIHRFERIIRDGVASEVVIGLRLRLDRDGDPLPVIEREELLRVPVAGSRVEDSARAFGEGVDQASAKLLSALQALPAPG